MTQRYRFTRYAYPLFVGCIYFFLYVPILLLIIFSFNSDSFASSWTGFTFRWYALLWEDTEVWDALKNSLIVASSTVVLSVSMGTLLVFYAQPRHLRRGMGFFYASLAVPEIVLAVGLLSFFYFFSIYLGLPTLIAAHTLIGLGYVVPILYTRYIEIDKRIIEASYDLGATREQTFIRIVLPLLSPAIITGALLVFIVSFDDFLLSFFCSGTAVQTLPIYIFALIRAGTSPMVNALSALLLSVSSLFIALFFFLRNKKTDIVS
ncbi:MAG: ABC transporter permease [Candidatus Dependentiae bacterium]|nr:ABC transporter permease [Candidatus Dependentiae bacterium]